MSEKPGQLLVCAAAEARALGHSYVGSEHLLLGLLTQTDTLGRAGFCGAQAFRRKIYG